MNNLKLNHYIIHMKYVTFDLETTGLDRTKDQIIQFAAIKLENNKLIEQLNLMIKPTGNYAISPQAYIKHGISAKSLEDKPTLAEVAQQIIDFFETPDTVSVVTYNGTSFDIPFLVNALKNIGIDFSFLGYKCYDAFLEEKNRNGNNLDRTYERYAHKTMEEAGLKAHDALSDVKATYSIFFAQQKILPYESVKMFGDDNSIAMMEFRGVVVPCFNIGKYKQLSLDFVKAYDRGYLEWCISDKCNFSDATKKFIAEGLNSKV